MNILEGITQVGAIINTTRDVVEALKPRPKPVPLQADPGAAEAYKCAVRARFLDELNRASARFIELRDLDGNGSLDPIELEMGQEAFARLDTNGDGEISLSELNQACLANPNVLNGDNPIVNV